MSNHQFNQHAGNDKHSRVRNQVSIHIKNMLRGVPLTSPKHTIFKVRRQLREVNEKAYDPQILAIGPYHYVNTKFKFMEVQKRRYLKKLLKRKGQSVRRYTRTLIEEGTLIEDEQRARDHYAETFDLSQEDFLAMMIIDGCFIIELFRKYVEGNEDYYSDSAEGREDYEYDSAEGRGRRGREVLDYDSAEGRGGGVVVVFDHDSAEGRGREVLDYDSAEGRGREVPDYDSVGREILECMYDMAEGRDENDADSAERDENAEGRDENDSDSAEGRDENVEGRDENDSDSAEGRDENDSDSAENDSAEGRDENDSDSSENDSAEGRDENDLVMHDLGIRSSIRRDLLLLENQLPFFVLSRLYHLIKDPHEPNEFIDVAAKYFILKVPSQRIGETEHLLHLYHTCKTFDMPGTEQVEWVSVMPSAAELRESGVRFRAVEKEWEPGDIKFENRTLEIPVLKVHDDTESKYRNLIAYEQHRQGGNIDEQHRQGGNIDERNIDEQHRQGGNIDEQHHQGRNIDERNIDEQNINEQHRQGKNIDYFTDYMKFMDCLINSSKDVAVLCRAGIIKNYLGDDEVVAQMFNKMCVNVLLHNSYYSKIYKKVNMHCAKRMNIWMAKLRREYFHSPWAFLSVVAAIVLLLLTAAQTVFTILS